MIYVANSIDGQICHKLNVFGYFSPSYILRHRRKCHQTKNPPMQQCYILIRYLVLLSDGYHYYYFVGNLIILLDHYHQIFTLILLFVFRGVLILIWKSMQETFEKLHSNCIKKCLNCCSCNGFCKVIKEHWYYFQITSFD